MVTRALLLHAFCGVLLALEVSFSIANVDQVGVGGLQGHWRCGGGVDVAVVEVVPANVGGDGVIMLTRRLHASCVCNASSLS